MLFLRKGNKQNMSEGGTIYYFPNKEVLSYYTRKQQHFIWQKSNQCKTDNWMINGTIHVELIKGGSWILVVGLQLLFHCVILIKLFGWLTYKLRFWFLRGEYNAFLNLGLNSPTTIYTNALELLHRIRRNRVHWKLKGWKALERKYWGGRAKEEGHWSWWKLEKWEKELKMNEEKINKGRQEEMKWRDYVRTILKTILYLRNKWSVEKMQGLCQPESSTWELYL